MRLLVRFIGGKRLPIEIHLGRVDVVLKPRDSLTLFWYTADILGDVNHLGIELLQHVPTQLVHWVCKNKPVVIQLLRPSNFPHDRNLDHPLGVGGGGEGGEGEEKGGSNDTVRCSGANNINYLWWPTSRWIPLGGSASSSAHDGLRFLRIWQNNTSPHSAERVLTFLLAEIIVRKDLDKV